MAGHLSRLLLKHLRNNSSKIMLRTGTHRIRHILPSNCCLHGTARYTTFPGIFSKQNVVKSLCTDLSDVVYCWNCNHGYQVEILGKKQFFCPACAVVQQPQENWSYFDILGCEQTFDLDVQLLTNNFRELQSLLHPDKFSLKSEEEQTYSGLQSSIVNEAYQTLLKPLSRGLYLLEIQGVSIEEGNMASDGDFLSYVMEINETLESGSENQLISLKEENKETIESCIQRLSDAFRNGNLHRAREVLLKMKYYDNIRMQIKEKLDME